jgi:hypothetical protein
VGALPPPYKANDDRPAGRACTFLTRVDGRPRTFGCSIVRPKHRASELDGLDLARLAAAAVGPADAAARGKVAILGRDDACVLQTAPGTAPVLVWCGHATSALALQSAIRKDSKAGVIRLVGPGRRTARVSFSTAGRRVSQTWRLPAPSYAEDRWRERIVLRMDALNPYAIVLGPLPAGVTPEGARRELVGSALGAKLAIVAKRPTGPAEVTFHNAGGTHGAAPMTGLATLAILSGLSSSLADFVLDRTITYQSQSGPVTTSLPDIRIEADGSVAISMPSVEVRLSPILLGGGQ